MSAAATNQERPAPGTPLADITHTIHDVSRIPVGHGRYSDTYTGVWSSPDGELKVAIKAIRATLNNFELEKVQRRMDRELCVWKGLAHSNVQTLSGIYNGIGSLPALVSPWCENGNINSFVLRRASDPNVGTTKLESIKLNLLIGVMSGVQFLHENRIVHGDIKGDNILISDRGATLVCDFGVSRIITELSESSTHWQTGPEETWRWIAPELCFVDGALPSYDTDIWACGCLFLEVWCSMLPYHLKTNQQQFLLAIHARESPCPARPANMPDFIWDLVQQCCNFDARQRPRPSRITQSLAESIPYQTPALRSIDVGSVALSVAWFPDGNRVAVGCEGGSVYILSLVTGATLLQLVGHTEVVNQVAVSPDARIVASCSDDRSIRLWDAEDGLAVGAPLVDHTDWVRSVAFSPDGRHLVSGSSDNTIRVWSTVTWATVLGPLHSHIYAVWSVTYSPDGSRIVSGSADRSVGVCDARTGDLILTLRGHTDWVLSVSYSPDGLHIVSLSYDRTVRIWDATTGRLVGSPLKGDSDWVTSVAYSPDGTRIVSGSDDHTVRIWDVVTGATIATLRGHTDWVYSAVFSPDGKRLASTSRDGTVRVWDATENWRRLDI